MTKQIAIFHLKSLLKEFKIYIDSGVLISISRENKLLLDWKERADTALEYIFENDDKIKEFKELNMSDNIYYGNIHYFVDFPVVKLLNKFLDEIKTFWKDDVIKVSSEDKKRKLNKSKVFIVHGHDELATTEIARYLEKLNIEPIILHEQASSSKTVIEKIEHYGNEVGFAIILYTECDIGGKDENSLKSRARQNVVLEHGYFISHLGRENTCALVKGKVETPSDIGGVVYVPMNDDSWHLSLAKELKSSGYEIDFNNLF